MKILKVIVVGMIVSIANKGFTQNPNSVRLWNEAVTQINASKQYMAEIWTGDIAEENFEPIDSIRLKNNEAFQAVKLNIYSTVEVTNDQESFDYKAVEKLSCSIMQFENVQRTDKGLKLLLLPKKDQLSQHALVLNISMKRLNTAEEKHKYNVLYYSFIELENIARENREMIKAAGTCENLKY